MTSDKIYRAQYWLFALCMTAAVTGLGSKADLALNRETGAFIAFTYFVQHLRSADFWAIAYWLATSIFTLSFPILIILEAIRRRA
jgi:hypothetical protein